MILLLHSSLPKSFEDATLPAVHQRLIDGGLPSDLIQYVEDVLIQQHKFYVNYMQQEANKKRELLKYIKQLEVGFSLQFDYIW